MAKNNRMIAGISNPSLTDQQLRVDELVSDRAPYCPEVKKLTSKAEELKCSQRQWDVEGHEEPLH